jgi:hypothetical protein
MAPDLRQRRPRGEDEPDSKGRTSSRPRSSTVPTELAPLGGSPPMTDPFRVALESAVAFEVSGGRAALEARRRSRITITTN